MKIATVMRALMLLGAASVAGAAAAQDPFAPTAGADPALFVKQWREASKAFDAPRKALLATMDKEIKAGPFRGDYESLNGYEIPQWFKDAKFGIFIHWGVYAVPAYGNTWYPRQMYVQGTDIFKHHVETYGTQDKFGYKDFVPMFKAERFDAKAWAHLFKQAGAQYVVPVFEHHDGFAMYDSALSDWTVVKKGPKRDTGGELAAAVRAEGMHFGASTHRIEHNFFMGGGRQFRSDVNDPANAELYGPAHAWLEAETDDSVYNDFTYVSKAFADDWLARSVEIVEKYKPEIMYFDWWNGQPSLRDDVARFAAYYYNRTLEKGGGIGIINYKYHAMSPHSAVLDLERGQLGEIRPLHWQTDTSISNKSWGYLAKDEYKSPDFIVHQLVDIVSKNGNLLLNVGPRADGTIPDEVQQILLSVGGWLKVNGEAIYGSTPWLVYGEGPNNVVGGSFNDTKATEWSTEDFRFTAKDGVLYAIQMKPSAGGEAVIRSLGARSGLVVRGVSILGEAPVTGFTQGSDGLHVRIGAKPAGQYALVYRIALEPVRH